MVDHDIGRNAELTYAVLRATCRNMEGEIVAMEVTVDHNGQIFTNSVPDQPTVIDLNVSE